VLVRLFAVGAVQASGPVQLVAVLAAAIPFLEPAYVWWLVILLSLQLYVVSNRPCADGA